MLVRIGYAAKSNTRGHTISQLLHVHCHRRCLDGNPVRFCQIKTTTKAGNAPCVAYLPICRFSRLIFNGEVINLTDGLIMSISKHTTQYNVFWDCAGAGIALFGLC